ncbi:patatin-like phospholipase family protein [Winogradskyella litorisediminis]|uniref:patatin-like phospholipase family protein n=1 Tax=Winogradskyella litorisediminis TaxID=1156618 RepID=UPI0036DCE298
MLTFCCVCSLSFYAQDEPRKKVGLVLSGGGAKGFAHIGTLKVIDSLGIKIDHIAGTSMGAIIGSLYASGYSGKQLDSLFRTIDFDVLINDKFPRNSKSLIERNNSERYAISLPFDGFKIKLPSGISRGQNVYGLLYKLLLASKDVKDFNKLPIPFFCVATNIETGAPVYFEQGNLAESVTASGAFPSLFQPVEIDGNIYIDGGVTNNYPIEELKERGIDIVIGVDVQDGLKDREQLTSAPEILLQINNYRTINDMRRKKKLTDIYIKPDITNFSVISFDEARDIVKVGVQAANKQLDALVALRATQSTSSNPISLKIPDSIKVGYVSVSGNDRYTRSYVLGKLKIRGSEKVSYDKLDKGIKSLVATNNFDAIRYDFISKENDSVDIKIRVKEAQTSTFLKLGLHYDELYRTAVLANLTKKRLFFKNDFASLDIILGDNIRYNFDYFIDKGFYLSVGLKSRFNQFDRSVNANLLFAPDNPILANINKVEVEQQDQTNQIYLQTLLAKEYEIKAGIEHKNLKITTENLSNGLNQEEAFTFDDSNYFSLFGNLKIDTYDNKHFPNNGFVFNGDAHWYIGANGLNSDFDGFSILKADMGYAFSLSDKLSFKIEASGGFQLGDRSTNFLDFAFGGYGENFINNINSFYGYDYLSIVGNSFVKGDFTIDYEIFEKNHILLAGNYANIGNNIFDDTTWISTPDYTGYALGYSLETFLGPIEAKYTFSPETKESHWFFNVGFWF